MRPQDGEEQSLYYRALKETLQAKAKKAVDFTVYIERRENMGASVFEFFAVFFINSEEWKVSTIVRGLDLKNVNQTADELIANLKRVRANERG